MYDQLITTLQLLEFAPKPGEIAVKIGPGKDDPEIKILVVGELDFTRAKTFLSSRLSSNVNLLDLLEKVESHLKYPRAKKRKRFFGNYAKMKRLPSFQQRHFDVNFFKSLHDEGEDKSSMRLDEFLNIYKSAKVAEQYAYFKPHMALKADWYGWF